MRFASRILTSLLGAALLTGCGSDGSQVQMAMDPSGGREVHPHAEPAQVLFERWYGSESERGAVEVLVAYELNAGTSRCMRQSGYAWDWAQGAMAGTRVDALGPVVWTGRPMRRDFSEPWLVNASFARAQQRMNGEGGMSPAEVSALDECLKAPGDGADIDSLRNPPGRDELFQAWVGALREATREFGEFSDYEGCMSTAQLDVLPGEEVTGENLATAFSRHRPSPQDIPMGQGDRGGESWESLIALEDQWLVVDWACRGDTYDAAMSKVPELIADFEIRHARQIRELEAYWDASVAQARRLQSPS